jgi:hypothetical protein
MGPETSRNRGMTRSGPKRGTPQPTLKLGGTCGWFPQVPHPTIEFRKNGAGGNRTPVHLRTCREKTRLLSRAQRQAQRVMLGGSGDGEVGRSADLPGSRLGLSPVLGRRWGHDPSLREPHRPWVRIRVEALSVGTARDGTPKWSKMMMPRSAFFLSTSGLPVSARDGGSNKGSISCHTTSGSSSAARFVPKCTCADSRTYRPILGF